jgi:hypothetical protein
MSNTALVAKSSMRTKWHFQHVWNMLEMVLKGLKEQFYEL